MRAFTIIALTVALFITTMSLKIGIESRGEINQLNNSISNLKKELARQDSLISLFRNNQSVTPIVKNHDLKSLKYRIYSIDRNDEVSSNELSEVLAEIVSEIEKLQKP